jgi:alpha-ketoglutarate-dependent 2,4-dichlorophenoxyacetate dioxygenase
MMAWTEHKLTPGFGMALSGQDLADPALPQPERDAVYAAVSRYGVAVVRDQDLSNDALYRFGASIGEVVELPRVAGVVPGHVASLTNLDDDGNILPLDARVHRELKTSYVWHIDSTYVKPRVRISMLFGRVVPSGCAATDFCDLRLAWEALSPTEQARLDGLTALHWLIHSRASSGVESSDEDRRRYQPIPRPLVAMHQESGRKALCLASHISGIVGMEDEAALALIADLTERAASPEHCYTHHWSPGDLLLWDNHAVMHRATPYDIAVHKRDMRTLRLEDCLDA